MQLLQCTASLPWGSGQWTSCNALPHCLGAVGSGTPAITGRTGLGGTGSPAQGVVGTSCKAHGEPSSSNNRAHRPGGDGESCPGGGRSLLPGPMGGHLLQRTGRTGPGGTGSPAQGVFGVSCQANGGPSSSENRAHRPGGDGESCPGGVRSLLPGQWGAIFFREPGAPAWGGRGVLPRGCSDPPARAMGGHLLQRTGRTGLGGTGSPAQGVFGVSCKASGGPSSSENRAHRPGGDGESCPGGVRSLLPGQWGAIFFREPGAPARGGRGLCCVVLCCVVLCCVVLCCVVLCCVVLCCVVLCCVVLCCVVLCCVLCCVVVYSTILQHSVPWAPYTPSHGSMIAWCPEFVGLNQHEIYASTQTRPRQNCGPPYLPNTTSHKIDLPLRFGVLPNAHQWLRARVPCRHGHDGNAHGIAGKFPCMAVRVLTLSPPTVMCKCPWQTLHPNHIPVKQQSPRALGGPPAPLVRQWAAQVPSSQSLFCFDVSAALSLCLYPPGHRTSTECCTCDHRCWPQPCEP